MMTRCSSIFPLLGSRLDSRKEEKTRRQRRRRCIRRQSGNYHRRRRRRRRERGRRGADQLQGHLRVHLRSASRSHPSCPRPHRVVGDSRPYLRHGDRTKEFQSRVAKGLSAMHLPRLLQQDAELEVVQYESNGGSHHGGARR